MGFYLEREGPPLYSNMPPVSGGLFWVRGLIDRIEEPMTKLTGTMKPLLESEEAKEVMRTYGNLLASLKEFEGEQHGEWGKSVEDVGQAKLKQPLLRRNDASLLVVNFDPELVRLLREVHYLLELGKEVPPTALELNKSAETFRVQRGSLQIITDKYNHIMQTMLDVEQPLLQAQLKAIDKARCTEPRTHRAAHSPPPCAFRAPPVHR